MSDIPNPFAGIEYLKPGSGNAETICMTPSERFPLPRTTKGGFPELQSADRPILRSLSELYPGLFRFHEIFFYPQSLLEQQTIWIYDFKKSFAFGLFMISATFEG